VNSLADVEGFIPGHADRAWTCSNPLETLHTRGDLVKIDKHYTRQKNYGQGTSVQFRYNLKSSYTKSKIIFLLRVHLLDFYIKKKFEKVSS
jgi:hypothetical protein